MTKLKNLILIPVILLTSSLFAQEGSEISGKAEENIIETITVSNVSSEAEKLIYLIEDEYIPDIENNVINRNRILSDSLKSNLEQITGVSTMILNQEFPYRYLEGFANKWERLIASTEEPEKSIKEHAERLDEILIDLRKRKEIWTATNLLYDTLEIRPIELMERIYLSVDNIDYVRQMALDSLEATIVVQNDVLDIKLQAQKYLTYLNEILQTQFSNILFRKNEPIWSSQLDSTNYDRTIASNKLWIPIASEEGKSYVIENAQRFYALAFVFVLLVMQVLWMKNQLTELKVKELFEIKLGEKVLNLPIGSAMLLTMMVSIFLLPNKALYISFISSVIFLVPFLIVTSKIIIKELKLSVYVMSFLLFLVNISKVFILGEYANRYFMLAVSMLLLANVYWIIKSTKELKSGEDTEDIWYQLLFNMMPLFGLGLILSIIANITGYVYISILATEGVLLSIIIAIMLGVVYVVLKSFIMLFLNTAFAQRSKLLEAYKEQTFYLVKKTLKILYYLAWLYFTASIIRLKDPLIEFILGIWVYGGEFGDFEISIGRVITFVVIVFFSWVLASFTKLFFQVEFLGRFDLPRGVPMAVGSLSNYAVMFIGFFIALSSLGFDMENFGLLAGALGVGIGFGLQNIVSNFISGLILVFERPITAGDIVTVDKIEGEVIAIGIRASKIRQYDGAELIVPNSDLISKNVVNWTLSDKRRRIKLVIQTDTSVNPEKVVEWMVESIHEVGGILKNPPAKAYFENVVDQSYQFYLLYWVSSNILATKNEVNINVIKHLKKNKVKVSVQRKIELTNKG
ncbi:MAG: mechanosensitive ion channel [Reichenbachiella sp.]